ncbi:Response regulator protein VraR [Synechococcus sp. MIT S9504]|nr:Response regulator protein VraR [Synechococcus sp. MIT S9504]
MARSRSKTSDLEKARRIRSLIHDQDLLICLYPHLFAVKQMLRLSGMRSKRIRRFYDSKTEAMIYLKNVKSPHWLLVSEQLSDGSGLDLLRESKRFLSSHRTLLLINRPGKSNLRIARGLNVDAVLNEVSLEQRSGALINALTSMKQGQHFEDPSLLEGERIVGRENAKVLSERQLEILALVAEGLSNRQIADQLNISVNTARDHLSEILTRLGVSNRASAVSAALRLGLIP